ncbi:MAG: M20/M25/M40 family metallo-hydrolase [Ottowia sp.]|uniref:M20 family metallopeptidase n=1 Tax=Ottowia sp. TaxID=1898956 RepID=UPI003C7732AA
MNMLPAFNPNPSLIRAVTAEAEQSREWLVNLCARMVAAESVNPPGATASMARVVEEALEALGLPSERVEQDAMAPNVVSFLRAAKPGRHVVFNAHMDTMLAGDESKWSVPILTLTRKDGRLYGLGMGNMKGALAAMLLAMKIVRERLPDLAGRLSLTAVSDEVMFGTRGTPYLLQQRPDLLGDYMISGEGPGWMNFAIAEKGLLWLDIHAEGEGGHASRALCGQTAVAKLSRFIAELDAWNTTFAKIPPELEGVEGGEGDAGLRLSVSVGHLNAGEVRSLIPSTAHAKADMRIPPGVDMPALKTRIDALANACGVKVVYTKGWPASWAPLASDLARSISAAAEGVRGSAPSFVVRLPGSDARYWRERGVLAACYGPQPTLSSGIDDYAEERDILDCAAIYALAAMALMSPSDLRG